MKRSFLLFLLALVLCVTCAAADHTIVWPETAHTLEDEVFCGDWSLDCVILPDTVTSIGSRAFAGSSLRTITLPADCSIAEDAFSDCRNVTVNTVSGSSSAVYATTCMDLNVRTYAAGTYTVGETIPANVYIIRADSGKTGTLTLKGGSLSAPVNRSFAGNMILRLCAGETLIMQNCSAVVDYEFDQRGQLKLGTDQVMLRIGVDLAPGDYALVLTGSGSGTVTWYSDDRLTVDRTEVLDQAFLEDEGTVHLEEGELVGFDGVRLPVADGIVTYRAFCLVETYPDTQYTLDAPGFDARAMSGMLSSLTGTRYQVKVGRDLGVMQIYTGILNAFSGADEDDVSLFFYSGHGTRGGCIVSAEMQTIPPSMLRSLLDRIPGTKVMIIDACYSGAMIPAESGAAAASVMALDDDEEAVNTDEDDDRDSGAASFVSSFNAAFGSGTRYRSRAMSNADQAPYYILTACAADEESWERKATVNGTTYFYGVFTYYLTRGCGWDHLGNKSLTRAYADANADGQLTLAELYSYAYAQVKGAGTPAPQTVSCYPSGSSFVLFGR